MLGCDSCGAQARRDDRSCPICGARLAAPAARAGSAKIPMRRFGKVPPYPVEFENGPGLPGRARHRMTPLALAALCALLLAAFAGYWLR